MFHAGLKGAVQVVRSGRLEAVDHRQQLQQMLWVWACHGRRGSGRLLFATIREQKFGSMLAWASSTPTWVIPPGRGAHVFARLSARGKRLSIILYTPWLIYAAHHRHKARTTRSVLAARARGTFLCNSEPTRTSAHGKCATVDPFSNPCKNSSQDPV